MTSERSEDNHVEIDPQELESLVNSDQLDIARSIISPTPIEPIPLFNTPEPPTSNIPQPQIESKLDERNITKPDGFDFEDPLELLLFLDDDLVSGRITLHKWQTQYLLDFAAGGVNDQHPFQSVVRACNGSGKDKYIIAPCAVWLLMRYTMSRVIVTSSSGVQLDNQTDAYINQLCLAANRKIHPNIWKLNYRYYECLPTQSPMVLFATDEPGKAEGYHPLRAGAKMAIFVSEDKTVPDEINLALNKCTGYTHRAHVSTPGLPMGHFYDICSTAVMRDTVKSVNDISAIDYVQYHVTAYDCSHISRNYIEQCKRDLPGGETGAAFKSQVLAEFGTTDEMVVIPYTYVWQAFNRAPNAGHVAEEHNTGGLDLSDGGDETCLVVRNGNKHIATIPFRFDNTEDTIEFLNQKFREWDLNTPLALVFADCGGLGKPMIDRLKRQGWSNLKYVDNRSKPIEPRIYLNRGAELWFHLRKLFERNEIILMKDDRLIRQLATRYYKLPSTGKHQLLSKLESRSRGYPSPDRADAFTLAFWNYKSKFVEDRSILNPPYEKVVYEKSKPDFDIRVWANKDNSNIIPNPSRGKDFSLYKDAIQLYNSTLASKQ